MNQRTRYFLVGSALVVVVGLCTGLVAYYNGSLPRQSSGPSELIYVPAATTAIAFADVHEIMNSQFHQRLRSMMPAGQGQDQLLADTGIDVQRDIDTVLAALPGAASPGTSPVIFVRGRFDQNRIQAAAVAHGAQVQQYQGHTLLVMSQDAAMASAPNAPAPAAPQPPAAPERPSGSPAAAHDHAGAIAFLQPGLLALGEPASVERSLDTAASHHDVTGNAELMKFVASVQSSGNAWVVGQFDALTSNPMMPAELKAHLPPVQWFALSAQVDSGVRGEVRAEASDDQSGEQLRSVVNGALSAARLMGGQDPRVTALLNNLQASGTGRDLAVSFTVPPEMLDMLPAAVKH